MAEQPTIKVPIPDEDHVYVVASYRTGYLVVPVHREDVGAHVREAIEDGMTQVDKAQGAAHV